MSSRGFFNEPGGRVPRPNRGFEIVPFNGSLRGSRQGYSVGGQGADPGSDWAVFFNFMSGLLDPRIAFTRAGNANYLGSDGLLKEALTDVPRFDYDYTTPGTPVLRGLLCEGAQDNQALWCRDLTNVAWTKSNMATALDQVGIDGVAASATKLTASAGNATVTQAITDASNVARTFSVYVKRITGTGNVDLTLDNGTGWTTVTVTAGWTRVAKTQTLINPTVGIRLVTSGDVIAVDYCQEEERGVASSPILTTTAIVNRPVDLALVSGANFTDWYVAGPGSHAVTLMLPTAPVNVVRVAASMNDNTSNEAFSLMIDGGSGTPRLQITDGGALQGNFTGGTPAVSTLYKYATSWAVNSFDGAINGANAGSSPDITGTLPTVTQLRLGAHSSGAGAGYCWVQDYKYWTTKKLAAELRSITT